MTGLLIAVSVFALPCLIVGLRHARCAFRDPGAVRRSALSRRYIDDQFEKPRNDWDLL